MRCDLWYIGLWLSTSIGIYRVLLYPCEKCHTIKRKQTLNSMVENHVKMTPLTQRKARHFTCLFKTIACPRTQFKHPLRWYCIAKNGIYIHDWNSGATNDPKSFVISHELSTKIALERVGGFAPLTSPSPLFLITPASNKETTHKEFILVVQIKTKTASVQTATKWILQRGHP